MKKNKLIKKILFLLFAIFIFFNIPCQKTEAVVCCYDPLKPGVCEEKESSTGCKFFRFGSCADCPLNICYCQGGGPAPANTLPPLPVQGKTETYISGPPIVPILSIPIPGLNLTSDPKLLRVCAECSESVVVSSDCPDEKCLKWTYQIPWIGQYISAFYKWSVSAIAIFAVLVIINSAFGMVLAGGSAEKIKAASSGIWAGIVGILLILIVHQALSMINPDLVIFKPIIIGGIKRQEVDNEELGFGEISAPPGDPENCPSISIEPGYSCQPNQIAQRAQNFLGQNSGPCHCACFVSRVLKSSNCGLTTLFTSVNGVENWLAEHGWKKYDVGKEKVTENARAGDIVATNGHIGISLGNGKIIDSGTISQGKTENSCTKLAISCPNVWHGLNYSNGQRYWSSDKCISNQTIKTRSNFFTRYWRKE